jgi:hypothetical protein
MATDAQRTRVWEDWLSAEIRAYYFADMAFRLESRQRVAHWVTLFGASGVVTSLLSTLPRWVALVLALLLTAVSIYSVVVQNQKRAADAKDLHFRWNTLASEYHDLWDNIETTTDLARAIQQLDLRKAEASRSAVALPAEEGRLDHWYNVVLAQHGLEQPA